MQPPNPTRMLSMRKSDGSVVESGEENPLLSRVSTQTQLHDFFDDADDEADATMIAERWEQFKATQQASSKFGIFFVNDRTEELRFDDVFNVQVTSEVRKKSSTGNCMFLQIEDFAKRKLVPGAAYVADFSFQNRGNESTVRRAVFLMPVVSDEASEGCTALVDACTWFNVTGYTARASGKLIVRIRRPASPQPLREIKIRPISFQSVRSPPKSALQTVLRRHFASPKLLHCGDVCEIISVDPGKTNPHLRFVFEVEFANTSQKTSPGDKKACGIVNHATAIYELPSRRQRFPRHVFDSEFEFLPPSAAEIGHKLGRLLVSHFAPSVTDENETETQLSLISVLAGTPGSGDCLILEFAADSAGVDLFWINCFDLWSPDGSSTTEAMESVLLNAALSQPAVIVVKNIDALVEDPAVTLDQGNKTLERLCKALEGSNYAVVFLCPRAELPSLPSPVARLIHFEFIIPDLKDSDRVDFFRFLQKKAGRCDRMIVDVKEDEFAALVRGFVLSELTQLTRDCHHSAIINSTSTIDAKTVEAAVALRNAAVASSIGAPKIPNVRWDDVGGLEDVKKIIAEALRANLTLSKPNSLLRRSGILLYGPPGCGKTLIAKAVASEFRIAFLAVKGPELLNQYVGQSEANLRAIFERARLASPAVVFFDEVDSLAPARGAAGDSGGVMDRMVSQLLAELDTLNSSDTAEVFVMAATNRVDLIDPSLLSRGRFDNAIHVRPYGDVAEKVQVLRPLCKNLNLEPGLTPEIIAAKCPATVSGAELAALVQKMTFSALREIIGRLESSTPPPPNLTPQTAIVITHKHLSEALKQ